MFTDAERLMGGQQSVTGQLWWLIRGSKWRLWLVTVLKIAMAADKCSSTHSSPLFCSLMAQIFHVSAVVRLTGHFESKTVKSVNWSRVGPLQAQAWRCFQRTGALVQWVVMESVVVFINLADHLAKVNQQSAKSTSCCFIVHRCQEEKRRPHNMCNVWQLESDWVQVQFVAWTNWTFIIIAVIY